MKQTLKSEMASPALQSSYQPPTWLSKGIQLLKKGNLGFDALFLGPAIILFSLFVIYPALISFFYSVTDWNGISQQANFIGLANFVQALRSGDLFRGLQVTVVFTLFALAIQNTFGLLLALALHNITRQVSTVLRVLFLIPMLISSLAVGYIWGYIYGPIYGVLNAVLARVGLTAWQQDWLGNPHLALGGIIVANLWQFTGFNMIIYLAGLQTVPVELLDAASIDGANPWQRFRSVTFPSIAPAVTVAVTLTLIGGLKIFDIIFVLTQGGPGNVTESLAFQVYKQAFTLNNFGYATALSIIMTSLIALVSLINLTILRQREVAA